MKKMDSFNPGKPSSGCSWQKVQRIISLGCALGIMTLGSTVELRAENNTAKNSANELAVAQANDGRVSGTVKDQNGEPLPGAVIRVKGTQIVTATDANGKYTLAKLPNGSELVVSSVGMATQTVLWVRKAK